MYEYILAVLPRKESKSLSGIKPFHSSRFFHVLSFLAMEVQEDRLRSTPIAGSIAVPGWECEGALGGLARFKRCTDFKSYLECSTKPIHSKANILCMTQRCKKATRGPGLILSRARAGRPPGPGAHQR